MARVTQAPLNMASLTSNGIYARILAMQEARSRRDGNLQHLLTDRKIERYNFDP